MLRKLRGKKPLLKKVKSKTFETRSKIGKRIENAGRELSQDNKRIRAPRAKHERRKAILYNVVLPMRIRDFRHTYQAVDFEETRGKQMTEVSVVIPTKNEEKSIGICIEKIQKVFNEHHIDGEIIIADNSTDNTPEIAEGMGAKVIAPDKHGYGNAYRFGFEHASGDYIVMGDGEQI